MVSSISCNLACAYVNLGQPAEDLPYGEQTVRVLRWAFPNGTADLGRAMLSLGDIYHKLGRTADCERTSLDGLQMMRERLGDTHFETIRVIRNLASYFEAHGDHVRSQELSRLLPAK